MKKLEVYIENLHNGKNAWIELPTSDIVINKVLEEINPGGLHDVIIADYETDISGLKVSEYDNILELNTIAEEIDNLSDDELIAFQAYLEQYANNIEQALEEVHQGNYRIYYNCDNMEDVAYQVVNDCGLLDGAPEELKVYFDYEAYGRDLSINGTFTQVDDAFVELF